MEKENKDLTVIEQKLSGMQKVVEKTTVKNDKDLNSITELIKNIKNLGKFIKAEKEKYTKPAQEIINNARAKYLPYEKACAEAERELKGKAGTYMQEQEEIRLEKERKILEDKRLKEETAEKKIEELEPVKKTVETDSGAKMTMRTIKTVEIVDREKIPHEYWVVDEVKVRQAVLAGTEVPGAKIVEKKSMSI